MKEVYLDNNATTRPLPEVVEAISWVLGEGFGNPSSAHGAGERGRRALERARASLAGLTAAAEEEVFFTSSGTEANSLVLLSVIEPERGRLITTEIEHSSILKTVEYLGQHGSEVTRLPVGRRGLVDLDQLAEELRSHPDLVSIQWVNNETGVVQPIEEIAALCCEYAVPLHADAAQALGKVPVDFTRVPITHLSCTGHKLHGPAGVGALITRQPQALRPLAFGGPQERSLRPGTENLPGIVGFGVASQLRRERFDQVVSQLTRLRDRFERKILDRLPGVTVNGDVSSRVCNTTNLLFHNTDGQALVARLDGLGLRCSQSSACTNQRPEPSYVLEAMGLTEDEAYGSVRFSLSELNAEEEVDRAANLVIQEVRSLRELFGYSGAA